MAAAVEHLDVIVIGAGLSGVDAAHHVIDGLTAATAMGPDGPVRVEFGADVFAGQALVVAIVPFSEQFAGLVDAQVGQFGGALGAGTR